MADNALAIPPGFQIYNGHKIDPIYQHRFTISWVSAAMLFVLVALPNFVHFARVGCVRDAVIGVRKVVNTYEPINAGREGTLSNSPSSRPPNIWRACNVLLLVKTSAMWTVSFIGLDIGQLVLILSFYVLTTLCSTLKAELIENPNRPGRIALAQLVPVFLLASKSSPLTILLSCGYEKLNFLHRWCSRCVLLAAAVHGLLWVRNRLEYGLPIFTRRKNVTGLTAFALLCVLALTSVRPVRARCYQLFHVIHLLTVPAFVIAMRYHTRHSVPYLYPSLAFWGLDLLLRLFRVRIRRATIFAPDPQMTIIRVHDCASGWRAGQHVRLRVFIAYRMFESHPLTIMNAPQATTCFGDVGVESELILGARVRGDWSLAVNLYACKIDSSLLEDTEGDDGLSKSSGIVITSGVADGSMQDSEAISLTDFSSRSKSATITDPLLPALTDWSLTDHGNPVKVMLDGPYGGCAFDIGMSQSVLLIAGGSGVTFTLGLLDDLVGRCLRLGRRKAEVTRRVEFAWCIRSLGALRWIVPFLTAISSRATSAPSESTLDLHIAVYVTHSSKAEAEDGVPPGPSIPNCNIIWERPRIRELIDDFASCRIPSDAESADGSLSASLDPDWSSLAVCAAGPESLTHEVKNAAARLALRNPSRRVDCHTEMYSI